MCWGSHSHLAPTFIYSDACSHYLCYVFCSLFPWMPHLHSSLHLLGRTFDVSHTKVSLPSQGYLYIQQCRKRGRSHPAWSQPYPFTPWDGWGPPVFAPSLVGLCSVPSITGCFFYDSPGVRPGGVNALGTACAQCPCQDLHTPPAHRSSLGLRVPLEVRDGVPRGCCCYCCQGCGRCYERNGATQRMKQRILSA